MDGRTRNDTFNTFNFTCLYSWFLNRDVVSYGTLRKRKVRDGEKRMKRIAFKKDSLCKSCGKKLRQGISKYCSSCRREIDRAEAQTKKLKKANSTSVLKKECDELHSLIIRLRDGKCMRCGTKNNLQRAHLINIGHMAHRWDENSSITLCYACHILWGHHHPLEFSEWLQETYPTKYNYWKDHKEDLQTKELSYIDIKFKLERRLKELNENHLRRL